MRSGVGEHFAAPELRTETVAPLWRAAVEEGRDFPAFLAEERGGWREVGWEEAARRVDELAAGFPALGLEQGDRVGLLSRTRLEWTLCDYALLSIGAVVVPIYPTSSSEETTHILADSGTRALVCEDEEAGRRLTKEPARA